MTTCFKRVLSVFAILCVLLNAPITVFAHSGRTDSSGGHKDNKNKSGLGSYHYHCGGYPAHLHDGGYCPYTDVFPTSVRVKADKTTLKIGEKVSISGSVYPENSVNTRVTWECSDDSVIRLKDGTVEAVGYGTAVITVTSFNGKTGTVTITVKEIVAQSVAISAPDTVTDMVYVGEAFNLEAVITPDNVDNPTITWSSSDENIAQVSPAGVVTPLAAGTVIITAETNNGVQSTYSVTVNEKLVESVEIKNGDKLDLLLEESITLDCVVLPEDASYPTVTWTTSDPNVITVNEDGLVNAVGCGTATVTAAVASGLYDEIDISVTEIVAEKIEISGEASIKIGAQTDLATTFIPLDTTIQSVEWISSDDSIASIDQDGHIIALGVGSVIITAKGKDVSSDFSFCVEPISVDRIVITRNTEDELKSGDTALFTAEVYPKDATYPGITWFTDNPKVATIDANGTLVANKAGTVVVTAQSDDGFVETYELKISLSDQSVALITGGSGAMGVGTLAVLINKKRRKNS